LQRTLSAGFIAPCLPIKTNKLPSGGQWLHEIKHDGFRVIARKNGSPCGAAGAGGGKDAMIETTHIQLAGHIFDHITGVCAKCGMTRTQYDDNGEPRCPGPPPEKHERLPIDED
jgi:hypothetical protein